MNRSIAAVVLVLTAALMLPLWAADESDPKGWEIVPPPPNSGGLFLVPRLTHVGSRLHLFWSGTDAMVRSPELFHASRTDADEVWTEAHAPFFGSARNRVRQLEVASSRDVIGVIFLRQMAQSPRAFEIMATFSGDNGWGFSAPFVVDSFVGPDAKGTCVTVGARDATKPEFAIAWAADEQALRAASLDFRSSTRPTALTVGHHEPGVDKIDLVGAGPAGFLTVFNEANTLKTARVKPLTGGVEPARGVVKGSFGRSFTAASHPRGPARLMTLEKGELISYEYRQDIWQKQGTARLEIASGAADVRSAMDDSRNVHLALHTGHKIYHLTDKGGNWSSPQAVIELDPQLPFSGFDVAATDSYVYLAAGQNNRLTVKRRKLETLP